MKHLQLTGSFRRDWKRLDPQAQHFIQPFINRLLQEDATLDIKRLQGTDHPIFRLRAGDYRVLFTRTS